MQLDEQLAGSTRLTSINNLPTFLQTLWQALAALQLGGFCIRSPQPYGSEISTNLSIYAQPPFASPVSTLRLPYLSTIIVSTAKSYSLASTSNMSIEAWADTVCQSPLRQDAGQQRAIDTLKAVFEDRRDPDSAASTIASIYDQRLKRGFKLSPVTELWGMICEAVRLLGGNREIDKRLIGLLNSISKLPDVTDDKGNAINPGGGITGVYWKDQPGLAIMFREYAIGTLPALYCGLPVV